MNQVYFVRVDSSTSGEILQAMMETISAEKRERVARYRIDADKKNGVYAEVLLRCLVSRDLGHNYKDIRISASPTGKPYFLNIYGCEFSISHTKGAISIALSNKPIGIDIERIREIDLVIAEKAFSDAEKAWLIDRSGDQYRRFFEIWTKKEALLKYLGRGISNDMKRYDVMSADLQEKISTMMIDGFVIAVCSSSDFRGDGPVEITESELIALWREYSNIKSKH